MLMTCNCHRPSSSAPGRRQHRAFFHKGVVVRLSHVQPWSRVVLAQQDQPSTMQCDDGLNAQFFGLQVTDDSEHPQLLEGLWLLLPAC